jgi:FtsH-binding integral membrane protein
MTRNARWPSSARSRSTRVVVGAIAECISAILVITAAIALSFRPGALEATRWFIAWGALGLLSGIGLYVQFGLARITSFVFSGANALLVGMAVVIGAGDPSAELWQTVVPGFVSLLGFVTLFGLGSLGRVLRWVSFD